MRRTFVLLLAVTSMFAFVGCATGYDSAAGYDVYGDEYGDDYGIDRYGVDGYYYNAGYGNGYGEGYGNGYGVDGYGVGYGVGPYNTGYDATDY